MPKLLRRYDEQGIAECGQIVLGHQRGISDVDVGSWCDPMLRQERRNVRQEGVIHRFIRGIAILWFPPQGDSTIDTQRGEDELLQVGALVLAIAIGNPKGTSCSWPPLGGR